MVYDTLTVVPTICIASNLQISLQSEADGHTSTNLRFVRRFVRPTHLYLMPKRQNQRKRTILL